MLLVITIHLTRDQRPTEGGGYGYLFAKSQVLFVTPIDGSQSIVVIALLVAIRICRCWENTKSAVPMTRPWLSDH